MKFIVISCALLQISFICGKSLHKIIDVSDNEIDDYEEQLKLGNIEEFMFSGPNTETGRLVSEWTEDADVNPEELGEYAEGDILFPSGWGKNGMKAESFRWPGAVVPFEIKGGFCKFYS